MMRKQNPRRVSFGIGLSVAVALFVCLGFAQANACTIPDPCPDCPTPVWWDTADAQIVFDPIPKIGKGKTSRAYRPGYPKKDWFKYTWNTFSSFDGNDFIGVAFQFTGDWGGDKPVVSITGYYDEQDLDPITMTLFSGDFNVDDGCAWINTTMYPQPARETFLIALGGPDYGFDVNCLTLGTKCVVPLPSTLLLLGGGLVGIFGLKRRKRS
jgi:hypothetical protein